MAFTRLLTIGPTHTLVQNTVYAMPARSTLGHTGVPGATLTCDDETTFTNPQTITIGADGSWSTRAPFIKATSGNITVTLKAA